MHDLRLAFRQLAKSPGFTILAIVTLGLGVGANTSMFTMLNALLLKPLPYADASRLDAIERITPQNPDERVSAADFLELQREMPRYGEIAAYTFADASLSESGQPPELAKAIRISANFFSTLGVEPLLGRDLEPREAISGNDRVIIISHRCWQQHFGGRSDIVGHVLRADGAPHTIIGVLPAHFSDFRHFGGVDVFRPLALEAGQVTDRRTLFLRLIGRPSPQLSRDEARGVIANFGARLAADHPDVNLGSIWQALPLNRTVIPKSGFVIMPMLVGLSGFVLLIACSNLANLLLVRTIARAREYAIRVALGASRSQVLRPLMADALRADECIEI